MDITLKKQHQQKPRQSEGKERTHDPPLDRRRAVQLIETALAQGVSLEKACRFLGISARTYQRWTRQGDVPDDGRPLAKRPPLTNRLSDGERVQILALCNRPEYSHLPPSQILPMLAVTGKYMASASSFSRV